MDIALSLYFYFAYTCIAVFFYQGNSIAHIEQCFLSSNRSAGSAES